MKHLSIIFMCLCIAIVSYFAVNANQPIDYETDLYWQAKALEGESKYHAQKEVEHKQLKEVKASEAVVKRGEHDKVKNGGSIYNTAREEHLNTKVTTSVDLPGFVGYQDLLASYAYNTCKKGMAGEAVSKNGYSYTCEDMILTWNSENGGWNYKTWNESNGNGTRDGGLCQVNSQYHSDHINSDRFLNPLAQFDYCLGIRKDASRKGVMPFYGYHVRHKRDKGIAFLN